ncbi:hypothetical protein DPMN_050948 [Dreissena polymorpha]|uniref:Uncharacterized protein n=1 Tax=Dreissena polymorpha TaxID=45954 RepID=A0A9D4CHQ1_DREPO|nr:hypothetical protein DPMN_050948 [Dreissena polymorpha]
MASSIRATYDIPDIYRNGFTMGRGNSFNLPENDAKKQRKSNRSDILKLSGVSRGCHPVRLHYQCDETKVLPSRRLGIELQDLDNTMNCT